MCFPVNQIDDLPSSNEKYSYPPGQQSIQILKSLLSKCTVIQNWIISGFPYFLCNTKGQLISKCPFGVIKSPKKPTIFFQDFCPSL